MAYFAVQLDVLSLLQSEFPTRWRPPTPSEIAPLFSFQEERILAGRRRPTERRGRRLSRAASLETRRRPFSAVQISPHVMMLSSTVLSVMIKLVRSSTRLQGCHFLFDSTTVLALCLVTIRLVYRTKQEMVLTQLSCSAFQCGYDPKGRGA